MAQQAWLEGVPSQLARYAACHAVMSFFLQGYTNTNMIVLANCSDLPGLTFSF
jgi:hypothetical protein